MGYRIDLSGKRFGRILVISFKGNGKNYKTLWNCKCDCGKEFVCTGSSLRSGNATSCGCYNREIISKNKRKKVRYEFDGEIGMCYSDDSHIAYFDKDDYEKIKGYGWSYGGENRYVSARDYATKKYVRMHRLVMGSPPKGYDIDHINHNKLDNRKSNLRVCTRSQNMRNMGKRKNSTGFRGVYKKRKKFTASIQVNGKSVGLGTFLTPEEAYKARVEAEKKYYGEFAYKDEENK
jgi:hypothetical protein